MLEKIYKINPSNEVLSKKLFNNRTRFTQINFTKELFEEKIEPYWDEAYNSWWYNKVGFEFGRDNAGITPYIIPLMFDLTFSSGDEYHLFTLQEMLRIVLDNYDEFNIVNTKNDKSNVLIGRIQQAYANLFRELHIPKYMLNKVGKLVKDYHADLKHGVDFIIDEMHPVAVKHFGKTTEDYDNRRKDAKNISNIYTFWSIRNGGNGIDMLDTNDMDKYLNNKSKHKNDLLLSEKCSFC